MNEDSECIFELKKCLDKMIHMYSKVYDKGVYACVYVVLDGKYDVEKVNSESKFLISNISLYDKDFNFYRCLYYKGKPTHKEFPVWVSLRDCFSNQYIPCSKIVIQIREI